MLSNDAIRYLYLTSCVHWFAAWMARHASYLIPMSSTCTTQRLYLNLSVYKACDRCASGLYSFSIFGVRFIYNKWHAAVPPRCQRCRAGILKPRFINYITLCPTTSLQSLHRYLQSMHLLWATAPWLQPVIWSAHSVLLWSLIHLPHSEHFVPSSLFNAALLIRKWNDTSLVPGP